MEGAHWLLFVAAVVVVVAFVCGLLGLSRRQTIACTALALVGTLVATGGLWLTAFGECLGENPDPPPPSSWPWSPRREFCTDGDSWAARGVLPLLALPFVLTLFGAFLWAWKRRILATAAFCGIAVTPFLPGVYVSMLPYYRTDAYPILHDPYVRPATEERRARACYVYAVVPRYRATPITDETERICADLTRTEETLQLVPDYYGLPGYAYTEVPSRLEWLGKNLTESGMKPGTEYDGLVAENVYRLPGRKAHEGAFLVRTSSP